MSIGVWAVMRRAYGEGRTTSHSPARRPLPRRMWMMLTPCAFCDLAVLAAVQLAMPSGNSRTSSVYSLFWTSMPSFEPLIGKYTTPSLCMPHCWAWSAAELLASGRNAARSTPGHPTRSAPSPCSRAARRPCRPPTSGSPGSRAATCRACGPPRSAPPRRRSGPPARRPVGHRSRPPRRRSASPRRATRSRGLLPGGPVATCGRRSPPAACGCRSRSRSSRRQPCRPLACVVGGAPSRSRHEGATTPATPRCRDGERRVDVRRTLWTARVPPHVRATSFARSRTRSTHRATSFARSRTRSTHRATSFARSRTRSTHVQTSTRRLIATTSPSAICSARRTATLIGTR